MDDLFNVKYTKMLSFSLVAEALTGLIYHRPSGENSNFQFSSHLRRLEKRKKDRILMLTLKQADVRLEHKARVDSLCLNLGQTLTGS